jgi:hypothetical protein
MAAGHGMADGGMADMAARARGDCDCHRYKAATGAKGQGRSVAPAAR